MTYLHHSEATDARSVSATGRTARAKSNASDHARTAVPTTRSEAPVDATRARIAVHCASPESPAVRRLLCAAARASLDAVCVPLLRPSLKGHDSGAFELAVLTCEDFETTARRELTRHLDAYSGRRLMVLAEENALAHFESMLGDGAAGVIPARFSEEAIEAALRLVRAGEVFRPGGIVAPIPQDAAAEAALRSFGLTKVEREVLALAAQGLTNLEIALRRNGVEGTIKVHMNHIFRKLKVRSRYEAMALYRQSHNFDQEEQRRAESGDMDMKWLLATMTHERHAKGTVLFRHGQPGEKIYYLQNGTVRLKEIGKDMGPRELFGEIGMFAPDHKRTCTAVCKTDVDLFSLSFEEVRRCYFVNPQFAYHVMHLITKRLIADSARDRHTIA